MNKEAKLENSEKTRKIEVVLQILKIIIQLLDKSFKENSSPTKAQ